MLDNRIVAVRKRDGSLHALGMIFSGPSAEDDANAEAKRRDEIAGYRLNPVDLFAGVPKSRFRDDRDEYTRISQASFTPVFDGVEDRSDNPFLSDQFKAAKQAAFGDGTETRSAYFKRAATEFDRNEEREAALAADLASPERRSAIEWAETHWRSVAFDPNQPLSAVVAAENLRKQASTPGASLNALKSMSTEAIEQQKSILADRRDKASQAKLAAQQAFDASSVEPTSFGGTPGIGPGDRVTKMRGIDGTVTYDVVSDRGILKSSFSADTVPDSVKALADQQG